MVYQVYTKCADMNGIEVEMFEISENGKLVNLFDPVLDRIKWWDIDARPLL